MVCTQCGSGIATGAKFCASCGERVEESAQSNVATSKTAVPGAPTVAPPGAPTVAPPGAPTVAPPGVAVQVPRWLSLDWLPAAFGALMVIASAVAVSLLVFLLIGALSGFGDGPPIFQTVMAIAAVVVGANVGLEGGFETVRFSTVAIPLVAIPVFVAYVYANRVAGVMSQDRSRFLAFAAKMGLIAGLLSVAIGALATIEFEYTRSSANFTVATGKGFLLLLLLVATGVLLSRHRPHLFLPHSVTSVLAAPLRVGLTAYLVVAVITYVMWLIFGITQAENLAFSQILGLLVLTLVFGGTLAAGAASLASGAPANLTGFVDFDFAAFNEFGSYHMFSTGAPLWLKSGLIILPAVVAYFTWRHLVRRQFAVQRDLIRFAASLGMVFGVCLAAGSVLARITLEFESNRDFFIFEMSHNFVLALVLGLFWGWIGAFGATVLWGNQNGIQVISITPEQSTPGS
jgi:hypothetical protein